MAVPTTCSRHCKLFLQHYSRQSLLTFTRAMAQLQSPVLPATGNFYADGKWIKADAAKTFPVTNPANAKELWQAANCGVTEFDEATAAARRAYEHWGYETTALERSKLLIAWYNKVVASKDALAQIITAENGKPLTESAGEVMYAASFLEWFGQEARRITGQIIDAPVKGRQHYHYREPAGVVGIITPWNFPAAMITRKVAAALACGCTVVVKPGEDTPLTALALAKLAEEAGIPAGVFNVVTADRDNSALIGQRMCDSTLIDVISFTGSTGVGKLLLSQSAHRVKRVCLELGGNAPFIVFDSADLDAAVQGLMVSKYRVSGQTCVCANRIFVHDSVFDAFVDKLKVEVDNLKVGDGVTAGVTQGPLVNARAVQKAEGLVEDAKAKGARVVLGGSRHPAGELFYQPTILTEVTPDMNVYNEEQFSPVAALVRFSSEEQVVAAANDARVGLAGYFYSQNLGQIFRVARKLQVGMVGCNEGLISCAEGAFGGFKESGLGREGSQLGIDEFLQWKYVCIKH